MWYGSDFLQLLGALLHQYQLGLEDFRLIFSNPKYPLRTSYFFSCLKQDHCLIYSFLKVYDLFITICWSLISRLPDNNSDKENSHARFLLSSRRPSSRHGDIQSDAPASTAATQRRLDYVELSPVSASSGPPPASQREAGEGQGRERECCGGEVGWSDG